MQVRSARLRLRSRRGPLAAVAPRGVVAGRTPFAPRLAGVALALALALAGGCSAWSGARLYGEGTRALDRGDVAGAVIRLEEAARLLPDSSEVQNHLGIAYESAGRHADARAAWERAVALDCANEAAAANLRAVSTEE